jgi:hypothetical protein
MSKLDHITLPDERIDLHLQAFFKAAMPAVWPGCPRPADRTTQPVYWSAAVKRRFALAASILLLFLAQMWLGTTFVGGERSSVSPNSPTEAHRRAVGRIHNPPLNLDDRRGRSLFLDDQHRSDRIRIPPRDPNDRR